MKILHVLTSPRAEGTPRLVLDWLQVNLSIEQELLFLQPDGGLKGEFESFGNFQYYNTDFKLSFKGGWKITKLVHRLIKERNPDVVICWNTGVSPWVLIGARMAGCKKLITHAGNYPGYKWNWNSLIHTNISGWTHFLFGGHMICCSAYVMEGYKRMPFSPASIYSYVYNCVSTQKFDDTNTWEGRKRTAIIVATLEKHKDHFTLLRSWQSLELAGVAEELYIVGDGSLRKKLIDFQDELGLKHVHFLGSRNDVPALLSQSKLFIFSTTPQEGFGTVLVEALASGCKVIASDVPACREVLRNGMFGQLVAPGSVDALATAVREAIIDKDFSADKVRVRAYVGQFATRYMIEAYLRQVDILLT